MTELELYTLLSSIVVAESTTINVAYDHFDEKTSPPFILYRNTDTTTFKAEDQVYFKNNQYIIDLVTEIKNPTLEAQVESVLNTNHLPYDKQEDYIEDERIFQIRYFI